MPRLSRSLKLAVAALTAAALVSPGAMGERAGAEQPERAFRAVPDVDGLADDAWGREVRFGRDLILRTYARIGPEVADPARRYAGNNLACGNCHLGAGTHPFGNPLLGALARYPSYRARSGGIGTLADRINGCMERSMNGRKLALDSPEMTAIIAYLRFLARGRPVGEPTPGEGAGHMPELARAADPEHGQTVYRAACAACHGANGEGKRNGVAGDARGYAVPPLWGPDSFNDGAGMARLGEAANFIRNNMPFGTTWRHPVLAPADAWDVAGFIQSQPRPHMVGLERDYPDRREKPVDAPYGPYADGFAEQQHRLGPFAPIRAALARLQAGRPPAR
jgi:thiosulfate dehydrogenase